MAALPGEEFALFHGQGTKHLFCSPLPAPHWPCHSQEVLPMVFAWTWGMILNGCYKVIKVERSGSGINSPQEPVFTPWPCPEPRKNWSTLWAPSSRDALDVWVFWLMLSKGRKYSSDSVPNREMTFFQHSRLQPSFPTVLQSRSSPGSCWERG